MARERDRAKMELGALMELLGGRGKSTKKKRTPFYRRGSHPIVTPKTAPQRAVLPLPLAVLPPSRGGLEDRGGTKPSAVLPRW